MTTTKTTLIIVRGASWGAHDTKDPLSALLYAQLDKEVTSTSSSPRPPTMSIVVGMDGRLEVHVHVMRYFCSNFDNLVDAKDGVLSVPDNFGVSMEAAKLFRKAVYLKELDPMTLDLWLQIRLLAVYLGCQEVLDQCEDVEITSSNCQTRSLLRNLKILVEKDPVGLHKYYTNNTGPESISSRTSSPKKEQNDGTPTIESSKKKRNHPVEEGKLLHNHDSSPSSSNVRRQPSPTDSADVAQKGGGDRGPERKRRHRSTVVDRPEPMSSIESLPTSSGGHSSTQKVSPPLDISQRVVVTGFKGLQKAIKGATSGQEIKLQAGIFEGQLDLKNLPEGVRIFGAGPSTIIRATGKYIWNILGAGRNCSIEAMKFENQDGDKKKKNLGLLVSSDTVKIRNLHFVGCYLSVGDSDGADICDVEVESSYFGILLDSKARNAVVKKAKFSNVRMGFDVRGICNTLSEIVCIDVKEGVIFNRTKTYPCHGNKLVDLVYTFANLECKKGSDAQMAVGIFGSKDNTVDNIKCLGYNGIPASAKKFSHALLITKQDPFTPENNTVKGVDGGLVNVTGKNNDIQQVTGCACLERIGHRHH